MLPALQMLRTYALICSSLPAAALSLKESHTFCIMAIPAAHQAVVGRVIVSLTISNFTAALR